MTGIAVIGTGYWGKNHVRGFKELLTEGEIDNLIVCDIDENKVKKFAEDFEIEYETDYKKLLKSDKVDAVSIVTPSPTHYPIGKEFIEAGLDVLVEKPMTMNITEAEKLLEVVEGSDRVFMVGHIFRYHSAVLELKRRMDAKEFGEIIYITSNRMAFRAPRKDMGVLYALAIHEVDLFCYLLNAENPLSIYAVLSHFFQPDIEETAMITMNFQNNITCFAFEGWLSPIHGKLRDLVIIGSNKSARVDYLKPAELQIYDSSVVVEDIEGRKEFRELHEGQRVIPIEYKEPLKEELKHFVARVKDRGRPISDAKIGLRAVEMVEKAKESAAKNKPILF
jgi:predicted dehydrogenase